MASAGGEEDDVAGRGGRLRVACGGGEVAINDAIDERRSLCDFLKRKRGEDDDDDDAALTA